MIQTNDCRQSIVIKNQFVSGFFNFDIDIMNMINTQIFDLVPKTFNDSHFEVFCLPSVIEGFALVPIWRIGDRRYFISTYSRQI